MAVLTIEDLLIKFGAGKSPRSQDYLDLIDTLADDRNAVYFSGTAPADTAANPLWFNTSTNVLSAYSAGSWRSGEGPQGPAGATGATGAAGAAGATGETGPGVATGGTTGQYLVKTDGTNYNTQWSTLDLSGKQDVVANVSSTEIGYLDGVTSAIQTQLNDKAPLASPALTGTPTAPLATTGTNTTQIATTSFVQQELNILTTGAPAALNTLDELAAALGDDSNYAATITTALGTKAPLNSPTLITPVLGVATATSINGTTIPTSKTLVATDTTDFVKTDGGSNITVASGSTVPLRITNVGTGDSFLVEDSANPDSSPFKIAADGKVSIGDSTPVSNTTTTSEHLLISTNTAAGGQLTIRKSFDGANNPNMYFAKSRGTNSVPTIVQSADNIGNIVSFGFDGTNYIQTTSILSSVDATPSTNIVPGRLTFNTCDATGVNVERMRIDSSGNTTINAIADATTTTAARGAGYMGVPQSAAATTGAYTIVAADAGEHIYSTATRTVTIPANASVAFPVGTAITFIAATGTTVTIAITTDTLLLAGAGTTGSRTLAPFGMATAIKITSTSWIISGNGLT